MRFYILYSAIISLMFGLMSCEAQQEYRFVELHGTMQHIRTKGNGKPSIVFVTGLATELDNFDSLQNSLSKVTTTFSYDRAGIGKSESLPSIRSIDNMAIELNELLVKEKIPTPYLLVGHSLGGYIIRYFTHLYPEKVCGLFLIDPSVENFDAEVREGLSPSEQLCYDSLQKIRTSWIQDERTPKVMRDEYLNYLTTDITLLNQTKLPSNIPITVLTANRFSEIEIKRGKIKREVDVWTALHKNWIQVAPQMRHVVIESGHYIHTEQPPLVLAELKLMLAKIKTN